MQQRLKMPRIFKQILKGSDSSAEERMCRMGISAFSYIPPACLELILFISFDKRYPWYPISSATRQYFGLANAPKRPSLVRLVSSIAATAK